jgi:hypothetical protein
MSSPLLSLLAPLLAAPLIFYACGLPWALATGRLHFAPLLGVAVAGLVAEVAYIAGGSVVVASATAVGLHVAAVGLLLRRSADTLPPVRQDFGEFFACYLLALLPVVIAPFPLPGRWAGDWIIVMETGHAMFTGAPLPEVALTRPPLFAAAASPLWCIGGKMAAVQIAAAVASAACLQIVRHLLPPTHRAAHVCLVAASLFFIQVTAATWAKFTSAAFLLAAWHALADRSLRATWIAGALLGLALAAHQAAVLFAPFLLLRLWSAALGHRIFGVPVVALVAFGGAAALFCLPWEIFTVVRYGLEAKASANPALGARPEIPAWANTALAGLTTFAGWGPVEPVLSLSGENVPRDAVFFLRAVFWVATSAFNTASGTLLGVLVPAGLALGWRMLGSELLRSWRESGRLSQLAWLFAFGANAVLNPYYSPDGTLQTGGVPAGLVGLIWASHRLTALGVGALRWALAWTFAGGALWVMFQLGLGLALRYSATARVRLRDTDFSFIQENNLASLGLALPLIVQVAILAAAAAVVFRSLRPLHHA